MNLLSEQVTENEIKIILRELNKAHAILGDVVEFGCYVGTTSVFIAKEIEKTEKTLWLYDSFEGLPEKSKQDENSLGEVFKKGELYSSKKQLINNLKKANLKTIPKITKGWFCDLTKEQMPEKISFAFLDGDYYASILDPLKLIWDNLSSGAIIIVDDYGNQALPGAEKAVRQWCNNKGLKYKVEDSLAIFCKK